MDEEVGLGRTPSKATLAMIRHLITDLCVLVGIAAGSCVVAAETDVTASTASQNLLVNGEFNFHSFESSRYGDCEVFRAPSVKQFQPRFPIEGIVVIHPGKTLSQFVLLSEVALDPGEPVSLSVYGYQTSSQALQASLMMM